MANIVKAHILGADEGAVDAAGCSTQLLWGTWDYQKTGAKEPAYNVDAPCVFLEIAEFESRVMRRNLYTGRVDFDGGIIRAPHDAIISDVLFGQANT